MRKLVLALLLLSVLSCQKQSPQQAATTTLTPDYFNDQIAKGLEQDSLQYYLEALNKVPKENLSDSLKAEFAYVAGRFNNRLKDHDKAIENFTYATSFIKDKIKHDREVLHLRALMETYFVRKNDYLNGEGTNEKLWSLLADNDHRNKAYVYSFRERVKKSLNKLDEALVANDSATKLFLRAGDTLNYFIMKMGRSNLLSSMAKPNEAIQTLHEVKPYEASLNTENKYLLHATLGYYHFVNYNLGEVISEYEKANVYAKKLPEHRGRSRVINNYLNLSNAHIERNELNLAEKFIDSIFNIGFENLEYFNQKAALKTKLEITYDKRADIQTVMSQLDSVFAYQEQNYDKQINSELNALKESYENERNLEAAKKEVEVENLKFERNQYILGILLLLAILAAILIAYFFKQRRFKAERQNFLLQQRLLRSQMNPHFTFNSLSMIGEGIENNREESANYIFKFSRLLRSIFENSTKDYVPLEDELQSLEDYIELQQFRFPDRFTYTLTNSVENDHEISVPPMLLQPFVENAILHGFREGSNSGKLSIVLSLEEKYIHCSIEDNGVGIDEKALNKRSSVKLIDQFLQRMTGTGITITNRSASNSQEKGTKVELNIPYLAQ